MNFNKLKKVTIGAMACVCLLTTTIPACAKNYPYEFTLKNTAETIVKSPVLKTDNEQTWYLTIDKVNAATGKSNTLSSTNIFGCKMHKSGSKKAVDVYHTFSNYVSGYGMKYQKKVKKDSKMTLAGKKDSRSTSSKTLKVSGRYAP